MLSNQSHFYDGGMAAAKKGEIFAAFVDQDTNQIDVWRAPDESGQFAAMPNPFPNMKMYSHPRLRISPYDDALYVAAQGSDFAVYMTRWTGQACR